jgi:hypothetical protein
MLARGAVVVSTAAGRTSSDFDTAAMQQPPEVKSVLPSAWSTTANTTVVLRGERCVSVRVQLASHPEVPGCDQGRWGGCRLAVATLWNTAPAPSPLHVVAVVVEGSTHGKGWTVGC